MEPGSGQQGEDDTGGLRQRGMAPDPCADADGDRMNASSVPLGPDTGAHRKNRKKTCWRRFLASPYYKFVILCIMSITPVYGNLVAMPKLLDARSVNGLCSRFANYVFTIWISVMFVYNFFMTQFTDPGGCASVRPPQEVTGQHELVLVEGSGEGGKERCTLLYAPGWCELCQHWKTPRSHHCSVCQRCVLRMDHHCPITGNCIGMKNHGHFLLFYIFALVGLTYSIGVCLVAILYGHWRMTPQTKALQDSVLVVTQGLIGIPGLLVQVFLKILVAAGGEVAFQTVFTAVAWVFVLACGCSALHLASKNTTLLEMSFPNKEWVQLKPKVYCPLGPGFYNCGWKQNFREVLGERWLLRLLLPVRGGPLSLRPAISPQPSPLGAEALRERLVQVEEQGVARQVASCQELGINPGPGGMVPDGV